MNRPSWQFYVWWGIERSPLKLGDTIELRVRESLAAILFVRLPARAAH